MDDMELEELKQHLLDLGKNKHFAQLRSELIELPPADIADIIEDFVDDEEITNDEVAVLFRLLPKDLAADTFVEMNSDLQELIITLMTDKELREVMNEMFVDDAADIIEEMPANVVKRVLKSVDAETRKNINTILNYPEDSAGTIMTMEYVSLKPEMTVAQAFNHIRETGLDKETIYTCYVTKNRMLLGIVSVKDLLLAKSDDVLTDIMEDNFIAVATTDDKEDVAEALRHYDFTALPVVDHDGRMVGIVTIDDAVDVLTEEATEDIEKMAGIMPSEHEYLRSGVFETFLKRIPWLMLLMLSSTFTSLILTSYEAQLAQVACLTAFIPMVTGTGGNSGSQSSVAVIRGLSLGEIEFKDIIAVLWKEIRISVLCGGALALAEFVKLIFIDRMLFGNEALSVTICAVICLALVFTVIIAKVVGGILPMIAEKVGLDPAVMASPFITTIVDALSILVYMNIARIVLGL